ncbi:MAG: hypothetical protein ACYDA3_14190 [Gaiellaceae bacterium]
MTETSVEPLLEWQGKSSATLRAVRPLAVWDSESVQPVEVVAPDQYCADLLLEYAAPLFPAEIVSGPGWVVRLQPRPIGRGSVLELLALVERWLESVPLPCAKLLYGGRSYLIRGAVDFAQFTAAAELASVPASRPNH